jgi:hypothetical protein
MLIETLDPQTGRPGAIPRTNATNAYDLLTDVITCIENEPRRLSMDHWFVRGRQLVGLLTDADLSPDDGPACDTAGCVAGWIVMLTTPTDRINFSEGAVQAGGAMRSASRYASSLLGTVLTGALFAPNVIDYGTADPDDEDDQDQWPTLHYAEAGYNDAVIKRIKDFQHDHREALRAKPIKSAENTRS